MNLDTGKMKHNSLIINVLIQFESYQV